MKKTFIVLLFCTIFFILAKPTYAIDNPFAFIFSFFQGNFASKNPEPILLLDPKTKKDNFTTYSKDKTNPNDLTTRGLNDKSRIIDQNKHIEDIILNTFSDESSPIINERDDKILAAVCNHLCVNKSEQSSPNCRPLATSEIAYFFLQNPNSAPDGLLDIFSSTEIVTRLNLKYKDKIELANSDCYPEIYNFLVTATPKSNDTDQAEQNTGISEQTNSIERTFIPQSVGDTPTPSLDFIDNLINTFNGGKTKKLKDNLYREQQFLTGFTPAKNQENLQFDNSNENIRNTFNNLMQPDSWK